MAQDDENQILKWTAVPPLPQFPTQVQAAGQVTNALAPVQTPVPVQALVPSPFLGPLGNTAPSPELMAQAQREEAIRRQVLERIYAGESPAYNRIYSPPGGPIHEFSSYADHPRIRIRIPDGPHKGEYSDAAGRPQFISRTWDPIAKTLGLKDFSPPNQDRATWYLANNTYRQQTGRDLFQDASLGRVDYSALAGQWPSLGKALTVSGKTRATDPMPGSAPIVPSGGFAPQPQDTTSVAPMVTDSDVSLDTPPAARSRISPEMLAMLQSLLTSPPVAKPVDYDPRKFLPKLEG